MIKSELIAIIANRHAHIPEHDIADSVNLMLELMSANLGTGGRIEIRGFGSFCLHYHPPRNAHNPKTGERVVTQGKHSPHFKAGKQLRDNVNAGAEQGLPIQNTANDSNSDDPDL